MYEVYPELANLNTELTAALSYLHERNSNSQVAIVRERLSDVQQAVNIRLDKKNHAWASKCHVDPAVLKRCAAKIRDARRLPASDYPAYRDPYDVLDNFGTSGSFCLEEQLVELDMVADELYGVFFSENTQWL